MTTIILSPERTPKALSWALGDATDVFPATDPGVGAVIINQEDVVVDGTLITTAPSSGDAVLLWAVCLFVFSLRYARGRSTGRFVASNILGVEDQALRDVPSKKLRGEIVKLLVPA